jgi:VWFA-related protein
MTRFPLFPISALLIAGALLAGPKATQMPQAGPLPEAGMVLVPVTVTDSLGRLVTGLDPGAFRVYEDKVEQKVSLESRDLPLSVGIVLDTSSSMEGKLADVPGALSQFLPIALARPNDEAFLIAFNDHPALVQGFTHDKEAIENSLAGLEVKGKTTLNDAVYLGLTEMEHAKNLRKVLVVISDGFNHGGVYSGADVAALAKKSRVEIYSIGMGDAPTARQRNPDNLAGMETLRQLSEPTGGRNFDGVNAILRDTFAKIGIELRNQYLLAYTPTNQTRDGKFRKITLKVGPIADLQSPRTFFRSGYYAPAH